MPETPNDIENLSPHKLLNNFSKNRVLPCILLALIVHLAVIGGFSVDYIYRTWIDPTAAAAQDGQPDGSPAEDQPGDAQPAGQAAGQPTPGEPGKGGPPAEGSGESPAGAEDAPVVTRVTDKPDPGKIPEEPAGVGIPLDDLND